MKPKIFTILFVLFLTSFLPISSNAISVCHCNQKYFSTEQKFNMSFGVFTGEVEKITPEYNPDRVKITFKILKSWKGIKYKTASVYTDSTDDISMVLHKNITCGYNFKMGEQYLIFSDRFKNAKGPSWVSACGDVVPLNDVSADALSFLSAIPEIELKEDSGGFGDGGFK
jgi:hypothetical protein